MEASLSRRTYMTFFLISILLNLLILLFVMTQHMQHIIHKPTFFKSAQEITLAEPKKLLKPAPAPAKPKAQPKPKSSPFYLASQSGHKAVSAPAKPKPVKHHTQTQETTPIDKSEQKIDSPQESVPAQNVENNQPPQQPDTPPQHATQEKNQSQEKNIAHMAAQAKTLKKEPTSILPQQKLEHTQQSLAPKTTPLKATQYPKQLNKQNNILKKTDPLRHKPHAKTIPLPKTTAQHIKSPQAVRANSPQKLTLAQLTKGFLNQLDQQPSAGSMKIVGKNNAQVTEEQLKYEQYAKKIIRCLQNSYRSHKHKAPFGRNNPPKIDIVMILDAKGLVKDTNIISSSGSPACNAFARSIFYDASDSLPPPPSWIASHERSFAWSDFFSLCQTPIEYIALSQK